MKTDTGNPLAQSPMHLLHRAYQAVGQVFTMGMQTNDLTPRQLAVLVAVAENEGLSQTDLVDRTGIDRSTLSDIVKRLTGKGLLQRRRTKEDARAYAVKLTEDGKRMLRTAEPLAKRIDDSHSRRPAGEAARPVPERLGVDHQHAGAVRARRKNVARTARSLTDLIGARRFS